MLRFFQVILVAFCLVFLSSCSGKRGGSITSFFSGGDEDSTEVRHETPVDVVEVEKLQAAIQSEPEYKIDNSEIETLKAEGIITDDDLAKIQAIQ